MTKPVITTRAGKGSALTWTEGDTNLTNLRDATVGLTVGQTTVTAELNGAITLVAGSNVTLTPDSQAGTITVAASGGSSLPNTDNTPGVLTNDGSGNLSWQKSVGDIRFDFNGASGQIETSYNGPLTILNNNQTGYGVVLSSNSTNLVVQGDFVRVGVYDAGQGTTRYSKFNTDGTVEFPAFKFPATDGSSNQVLKTNGQGILTWGDAGASTGNVTFSGNTISTSSSGNPLLLQSATGDGAGIFGGNGADYSKVTALPTYVDVQTWENGVGGKQWKFNNDGELVFPDNTVQTTAYTGGGSLPSNASGYLKNDGQGTLSWSGTGNDLNFVLSNDVYTANLTGSSDLHYVELKGNYTTSAVQLVFKNSNNSALGTIGANSSGATSLTGAAGNGELGIQSGDIYFNPGTNKNVYLNQLKFPNTDGSADQVLKTDGSGNLSWTTISSFDPASPGAIGGTTANTGAFTTLSASTTTTSGAVNVTYTPSAESGAAIQVTGKDSQGGTGYFDFLKVTNTTNGASNGNKTFRMNSMGNIEIINSAYTASIFNLSDAGAMTVGGTTFPTSTGTSGQVLTADGTGGASWATAGGGGPAIATVFKGTYSSNSATWATILTNNAGISLSSGGAGVIVPAGTWMFRITYMNAVTSSSSTNFNIRNETDGSDLSQNTFSSSYTQRPGFSINSPFTVSSGTKEIRLTVSNSNNYLIQVFFDIYKIS